MRTIIVRLIAVACVLVFAAGHAHARGRGHIWHHRVHHARVVRHHAPRLRCLPAQCDPVGSPVVEDGRSDAVSIAERFLGSHNPTGFRGPWCGAFAALVARIGHFFVPKGYLKAREWVNAGPRVSTPDRNTVSVWTGHVAFPIAWPRIISGNFGRKVAEGVQRRQRFLGFYALRRI
jgi:hypothetical protein